MATGNLTRRTLLAALAVAPLANRTSAQTTTWPDRPVRVIDRLVLKIYPYVFKRAFHTHSRMDGLVRSFIARRNISIAVHHLRNTAI